MIICPEPSLEATHSRPFSRFIILIIIIKLNDKIHPITGHEVPEGE
jgi:hypothetical protein